MAKDMRACIKDFLKHANSLAQEDGPDGSGFYKEYRSLQDLQLKNRRENVFTTNVGNEEYNLKKNRYKDILPYDAHRVSLCVKEDEEPGSDYINANHIMGVKGSNGGYIASQAPLAATLNDFWRLIWEKRIDTVFMACRIVEKGKIKCKQYWNDVDCSQQYGDVMVHTESEENVSSDFTRRIFQVTCGDEERVVTQLHYSGWPDHGVPENPKHIRGLLSLMRQSRENVNMPLLIHCSAGCGRTGAVIAIDYVWTLLEEGKLDEKFNLYNLICKLREQRMSLIQTEDQYEFVYGVLKSLCVDWLEKMDSHTYENVTPDSDYGNFDSSRYQEPKEHIYEDSKTLAELKISENSSSSEPEVTHSLASPGIKQNNEFEEKTPLSPKTAKPTANSYCNVDFSNNRPQLEISPKRVKPTENSYSNVEITNSRPTIQHSQTLPDSLEDERVCHKTVIEIGAGKELPLSSGNARDVVNLIRSDKVTRHSLKRLNSAPNLPPPPKPSRASALPAISPQHTANPKQVPGDPPGFNQRLPRVQGPVLEPAHWTADT